MPSLSFLTPGAPVLPPGLTPVAANPIAAVGGAGDAGFADMIAGLGQGAPGLKASFAAPLPPAQQGDPELPVVTAPAPGPPSGSDLPPDRPEIAGLSPPLPHVPVEDVMIGSAPVPASPPTIPCDTPTPTVQPETDDAPAPNAAPILSGLRQWRLGGASPLALARIIVKPLPMPVPAQQVVEEGAVHEPSGKKPASDPAPAVATDPSAPPPAFAPMIWAAPAAPAPKTRIEDSQSASPQPSASAPLDAAKPALQAQTQPTAAATPAQAHMALPQNMVLPPEVAREFAQLVRSATEERDPRTPDIAPAFDAATLPLAAPPAAPLHASFVSAHRPAIDTGRAEWMQNMIDRIAELPQADGRRDAQLRLVPDALGPVEVRIEQREQRLHVTLNAQTPEARQLLSDAAPKLQELAEARGIRFAQTGFGGADAQDRRSQPDQQSATPLRPRSAFAEAEPEAQPDSDLIA